MNDPYWLWLIDIRKYLRYLQMSKVSDSQLDKMDLLLGKMMNQRLKLTLVDPTSEKEFNAPEITSDSDSESEIEIETTDEPNTNAPTEKAKKKYNPPLRQSHYREVPQ